MAGCYGNNNFDKHFENLLEDYLNSIEDNQPFDYDNYERYQTCECCKHKFDVTDYEEDTIHIESVDEHWVYCTNCDEATQLEFS